MSRSVRIPLPLPLPPDVVAWPTPPVTMLRLDDHGGGRLSISVTSRTGTHTYWQSVDDGETWKQVADSPTPVAKGPNQWWANSDVKPDTSDPILGEVVAELAARGHFAKVTYEVTDGCPFHWVGEVHILHPDNPSVTYTAEVYGSADEFVAEVRRAMGLVAGSPAGERR